MIIIINYNSGETFFFAQNVVTMAEFREGGVVIELPNATLTFPKNFDEQIAHVCCCYYYYYYYYY